jgi:prepilin-type N-terminal cleavage/methylation domain-containing protein
LGAGRLVRCHQNSSSGDTIDLKIFAKNAARPWGFTLVELLTVIAIIGVLVTLLSATLSTAKKKARKTASIGNLRQIALALNVYSDDHHKRPALFRALTKENYLVQRVLFCPEDQTTQENGWAGFFEMWETAARFGFSDAGTLPADVPHSYFKSFSYSDELWERIERNPLGGVAACQLHGIGRQRKDQPAPLEAFQGLVLRALKDGSVISRQVFWNEFAGTAGPDVAMGAPSELNPSRSSELPFFLDPVE